MKQAAHPTTPPTRHRLPRIAAKPYREHGCRYRPTSTLCVIHVIQEARGHQSRTSSRRPPLLYFRTHASIFVQSLYQQATRTQGSNSACGRSGCDAPCGYSQRRAAVQSCQPNYQHSGSKSFLSTRHLGHKPSLQCGTASTWS